MSENHTLTLLQSIDAAAEALIQKAMGSPNAEDKALLPEQIKAFSAVVNWFEVRSEIAPKDEKPKETKFERLKRSFTDGASGDGAPNPRRGGARKAPPGLDLSGSNLSAGSPAAPASANVASTASGGSKAN